MIFLGSSGGDDCKPGEGIRARIMVSVNINEKVRRNSIFFRAVCQVNPSQYIQNKALCQACVAYLQLLPENRAILFVTVDNALALHANWII